MRRVRAAIDADRPVAAADHEVAEQVLARLCWSTPTLVLYGVVSVVFQAGAARIVASGAWRAGSGVFEIVVGLALFTFCMYVDRQQVRLRSWRQTHLRRGTG